MRDGVPRLLELFAARGIHASFFFAMGPDHSGRAIRNLLRSGFFNKMRRNSALRTYGLRTCLSGTLLPARAIGRGFPELIVRAAKEGHDVGPHGWDHRLWQDGLFEMSDEQTRAEVDRAFGSFEAADGRRAETTAAPAWMITDAALEYQDAKSLLFASDCRGEAPFQPVVHGRRLLVPQVPTTLPTLDEVSSGDAGAARRFFDRVLTASCSGRSHVLAVHAELEGGPYLAEFSGFLENVQRTGVCVAPLSLVLRRSQNAGPLPACELTRGTVRGRHGEVSLQSAREWTALPAGCGD